MKRSLYFIFLVVLYSLLLSSCKKDNFITSGNARLIITADTLHYDTVFTTKGSITKSFKIINENDQKLLLSKVKLMGGNASPYKININGTAITEANDIAIEGNDSIYVFVSVTIDPSVADLPFVVSDSILIAYNGKNRFVQLRAYGQNANFYNNHIITGNVVWPNDLPYVITGSLQIDTTASLTIESGCKIYSHGDAPFIVDGTLIINGTKADNVVFAGDRLDGDYKNLPASWPGIYFRGESKDNVLTFGVIKNANQAIVVEKPSINANPKVILHQCIIDNAYDKGIYCANSSLTADNTLISNCGNNIVISYGGNYNFTHCTVVSYSNNYLFRKNPVLSVNNFATKSGGTVTADINAIFRNCIFWGDDNGAVNNEVVVNKQGGNTFSVLFEKNIYRVANDPANSILTGNIKNQNPLFDSINVAKNIFDFHITKNAIAPGINAGVMTAFIKDLDNNMRNVGVPDLGCYEKQ